MIHSVSFGNITKPYPGFYTNPESYILENSSQQQTKHMPVTQSQQKTSTSKHKTRQNSDNTVKWLFGAIALAGLATLGILGHKGYLGEDIQKLLGGLKKLNLHLRILSPVVKKNPNKIPKLYIQMKHQK